METDVAHAKLLRRNLELLDGVAQVDVLRMDARSAPKRLCSRGDRFHLVFLDPPYATGLAAEVLRALGENEGVLQEGAVVVVESSSAEPLPPQIGSLRRDDERRFGGTTLSFYRGSSASVGEA